MEPRHSLLARISVAVAFALGGLDIALERTFGIFHPMIRAPGENLIALKFGLFLVTSVNDRATGIVDSPSENLGGFLRVGEQLTQEVDHVLKRVLFVIENDDMIGRLLASAGGRIGFRFDLGTNDRRLGHGRPGFGFLRLAHAKLPMRSCDQPLQKEPTHISLKALQAVAENFERAASLLLCKNQIVSARMLIFQASLELEISYAKIRPTFPRV